MTFSTTCKGLWGGIGLVALLTLALAYPPSVQSTSYLGTPPVNASTLWGTLTTPVATTSGTTVDILNIIPNIKRVTIYFRGVSTDAAGDYLIQLGDATSVKTSGYLGSVTATFSSSSAPTTGMGVATGTSAGSIITGYCVLSLYSTTPSIVWIGICTNSFQNTASTVTSSSQITLVSALTRIRLTTFTGLPNFDAGAISLLVE